MSHWTDSSVVVGLARRATATSAVWRVARVVLWPLRAVRAATAAIEARLRQPPRPEPSVDVLVVPGSRLLELPERFFGRVAAVYADSTARRAAREVVAVLSALDRWQQVRLAGWTVVIAVATHAIVASPLDPQYRSALAQAHPVLALVGVLLMVGARPLANAWTDKTRRRRSAELSGRSRSQDGPHGSEEPA